MRGRSFFLCGFLFPAALATAQSAGKGTAVFAGSVVDSLQRPLANADVSLPGLSIAAATDANGAFRIMGIPPGSQRVVVRRLGFGQLDTSFVFADSQTITHRVTLGRIVMLDSVVVGATKIDRDLAAFEENRARGFGKFVGPAELERAQGATLSAVLEGLQGVFISHGTAGEAWVSGKRPPPSRCTGGGPALTAAAAVEAQRRIDDCLRSERVYYVPEDYEARQGMKRACYALVYLDRAPMNTGHPTLPFDANTLLTPQILAVEWYESASQAPQEYSAADARCGLMVLRSKRR